MTTTCRDPKPRRKSGMLPKGKSPKSACGTAKSVSKNESKGKPRGAPTGNPKRVSMGTPDGTSSSGSGALAHSGDLFPPRIRAIGVDVSKDTLEVALSPTGPNQTLTNDEPGIRSLIKLLEEQRPDIVIFEPTGGYERLLRSRLAKTTFRFAMVDAKAARNFILATGERAKTDRIDARMLAAYGATMPVRLAAQPTPELEELRALNDRRTQIVECVTVERGHLSSAHPSIAKDIQRSIRRLNAEIAKLDARILERIRQSPELNRLYQILTSVKGVGLVVAATILTRLPEIGTLSRGKIAALVGVAPFPHSSGKKSKPTSICGGRAEVRKALYMGALNVVTREPRFKDFYQRLIGRGKPPKVALTAVMRKLIVALNAMVRNGEAWRAEGDVKHGGRSANDGDGATGSAGVADVVGDTDGTDGTPQAINEQETAPKKGLLPPLSGRTKSARTTTSTARKPAKNRRTSAVI